MRIIALCLCCLAFAGLAFSDDLSAAIRDYNAAQDSGDPVAKVEAARTLGRAAIAAPAEADTPILVFEAAQTLALNRAEIETAELIAWLDAETFPEGSPIAQIDVDLLVSYVRWAENADKASRQALDDALMAVSVYEPTLLTLLVFQKRYIADFESGAFQKLPESALAAAEHLQPVKHIFGEGWSNAAIVAHSSAFNRSTSEESLYGMAEHFIDLQKMHSSMHAESAEHPEWINSQMYRAETWYLAMDAFLASEQARNYSKRTRREKRLEEILDWQPEQAATHPEDTPDDEALDRLPFCAGRFDMRPEMEYPRTANRQGRVGAVLLSFDIKDGRVSEAEVLAAIPNEGFAEDSIKTLKKWTWLVDKDADREACGLDAENVRMPFTFVFQ